MGKKVFEKIIAFLNEKKVDYTHLTHEHVHTSKDAAKVRGNTIEQAAKAIVLKVKNKNKEYGFIQCVVPGNLKINFKKLRKELGLKSVSLATPDEVLEKTGCTVGSVPPFGIFFDMKIYADLEIKNKDDIVFSAGTHNDSIRMKSDDYIRVIEPKIIDISELK